MDLKQIFKEDITRQIEGVIKADDNENLLQEVKEYVFTAEIRKKITRGFIDFYNDYNGVNGVWISGFFGSGKSHLLKMLSLLLENKELDGKPVSEYFLPKVDDEILKAEFQKAVRIPSKSILFNIDQKADIISKGQEDAVLSVFMKVFNEMQGYYPKLGFIAEFERDLDNEGLYGQFKEAFEKIDGRPWEKRRKRLKMATRQFAKALAQVKDISEEEASKFIDHYRQDYKVSIEYFANLVKEYLDKQPEGFRLNFFVDEVGQYISDNTKLMTNLQTIAESLATKCKGRAWVFVTSQEDMDSVIGGLKERQSNDFSKIQARFASKINLTSGNVDEVIQRRLLDKNEAGIDELLPLYQKEKNNFQTLFQFSEGGTSYRGYQDAHHFVATYPFLPYQFNLFQESMRGLSVQNAFQGKHQSVGERSMLTVFQEVVKGMIDDGMASGKIASFGQMYDGLQATLRGEIQSSINRAEQNLEAPFHLKVLKALFLIKYVKTFKPSLKHIAILLIDDFNIDLAQHEKRVQEALNVLEYQTYIQRNGELYEYLTNEEKNIENDIKATEVDPDEVGAFFAKIVFEDVIIDNKIRYQDNKQDYPFTKKIDNAILGREQELSLHVVTPLHEHYDSEQLLKAHTMGKPELLFVLPEDGRLMEDLRMFKKVERYFHQNYTTDLKEEIQQILQRKKLSNNELRTNLIKRVERLIGKATVILDGKELNVSPSSARNRVSTAFQDLIGYAYENLRMLKKEFREEDIRTILMSKADDLFQHTDESMSEAEREMLTTITRNANRGERSTVKGLLGQFSRRPYGWYETGILCILAKLLVRNKVEIKENSELLDNHQVLANLNNNRLFGQTVVEPLPEVDARSVKALKDLHRELFNEANPGKEPKEVGLAFQDKLKEEYREVQQLLRQKSQYPFLEVLEPFVGDIERLSRKDYSKYFEELPDFGHQLLDFKDDALDPVKKFMNGSQAKIYDDIKLFLERGDANYRYIEAHEVEALREVLQHKRPYLGQMMQLAKEQLDSCKEKVKGAIETEKNKAEKRISELMEKIQGFEEFEKVSPAFQKRTLGYFQDAIARIRSDRYIANIRDRVRQFEEEDFQQHLQALAEMGAPKPEPAKEERASSATGDGQPQPAKANDRKTAYVPVRKIRVGFKKPYLRTEEDVLEYLDKLKEEYLKLIREDKGISL
ncbi:MAG: BREX system P-loop protein BrxC [Lewinellaceae bacterium]|nr:BREX system P-loop protein BrxC [Lewinellaceae bacterium]